MDDLSNTVTADATKQAWARRLLLTLLMIWAVSAVIAVVSFRIEWNQWPPLSEAVKGLTLLAPVGLPMGFVQALGARNVWRGVQMLLIVISFWTTVTAVLLYAYHRRSKLALAVLFVIFLIAALDWLYLAREFPGF